MRKPSFTRFYQFKRLFDKINKEAGLNQQIIPYFISSHPGCKEEDMAELAILTKDLNFRLEQVQDFTPTPMTVSTETWYTGFDPYTLEPVSCAKTPKEKLAQRQFFFWYKPEERRNIESELRRIGRPDLIKKLYDGVPYRGRVQYDDKAVGSRPDSHERENRKDHRRGSDSRGANTVKGKSKPKSFNPNFNPGARRKKGR
jgi:radical SAM superfamily enzyme YgiQ (UPF0313 family)